MWTIIIFSVLFLVFFALTLHHLMDGEAFGTVAFGIMSLFMFGLVLLSAAEAGNKAPRITEGHYYEVVFTIPIQNSSETLVYAIDLKESKKKADILAEYPLKGYNIMQSGKRTFLLPESTRITTDTMGNIVIVSEEGMAIDVPTTVSGK